MYCTEGGEVWHFPGALRSASSNKSAIVAFGLFVVVVVVLSVFYFNYENFLRASTTQKAGLNNRHPLVNGFLGLCLQFLCGFASFFFFNFIFIVLSPPTKNFHFVVCRLK